MSDVYGVTPEDVSAEMPGLFSVGFTQASRPTRATVIGWITDADAYIDTQVTQVTTVNPDLADAASRLARRWIITDVKDRVREAATNLSPADLVALRQTSPASALLVQIQALASSEIAAQLAALEEATLSGPRLAITMGGLTSGVPARDLVINDADLDGDRGPSGTSEVLDSSTRWHRRSRF